MLGKQLWFSCDGDIDCDSEVLADGKGATVANLTRVCSGRRVGCHPRWSAILSETSSVIGNPTRYPVIE